MTRHGVGVGVGARCCGWCLVLPLHGAYPADACVGSCSGNSSFQYSLGGRLDTGVGFVPGLGVGPGEGEVVPVDRLLRAAVPF